MKERFYKSAKWMFNIVIATIAWMFILNVIKDYHGVEWCFFSMLEDDWDGAVYCIAGTACIEETIRNIAKGVVKFVKEIKG